MHQSQQVSVIMPCYNHARFLQDSVRGVLEQKHVDLELIVVDDRSRDNSWEVLSALAAADSRIKPIRHECNSGASAARNTGIKHASGAYLAFCDADDVWEPEKLAIQLSFLNQNRENDVVYCDASILDESGKPTGTRFSELYPPPTPPSGNLFHSLVLTNFINIQGVLMRRSCTDSAGVFDRSIKWVEDWWYWIRTAEKHRFLYIPQPLARYRTHSLSTNRVHRRGYCVNRFKVYSRVLHRYPDLPAGLRAQIWYHLGTALCDAGRRQFGAAVLRRAMSESIFRGFAPKCFLQAVRQLALNARKKRLPTHSTTAKR